METPRSAFKPTWYQNSPGEVMDMESPMATPIAPLQSAELRDARETIEEQEREIARLRAHLDRAEAQNQTLSQTTQQKDQLINKLIEERKNASMETSSMSTKMQEFQITMQDQLKQAQIEAKYDRERLQTVMQQLATSVTSEERLRSEMRSLESQARLARQDLESRLEKTRSERDEFRRLYDNLSQEFTALQSNAEGQLAFGREQLRLAKERVHELEGQLSQSRKRGYEEMEASSQIDYLNATIRQQEQTIKLLQQNEAARQEFDQVSSSYRTQAARVPALEQQLRDAQTEIQHVKKRTHDYEALKEQNITLMKAHSQFQRLEQENAKMKVELEGLRQEKTAWEGFLAGLPGFESAEEVKRNVADMQRQNLTLLDNNGQLTAELRRVTRIMEERDGQVKDLTEQLVSAKDSADDSKRSLEYSNLRLREAERRVNNLQDLLQSYRMEEQITANGFDAAKAAQIRELERQLTEKAQTLSKFETEVEQCRQAIKQLEKENERLVADKAVLENRVGRGDYNPASTKILHLAFTPDMIRQERDGQREIEQLREKIKLLEEELAVLKSSAASSTSLGEAQQRSEQISAELRSLRQDNVTLKEQLKEKEYFNKRFTEVCTTRLKEFKDSCFQLFGWKIDIDDQTGRRYRLQSMFSRNNEEFLLFQYSKKEMVLWETEFSKSIDSSISHFLTQHGCIPAFLSSLSLALFERSQRK